MQSPNKRAPTRAEREHIERIKEMECAVCHQPGPSEVHEIEQGEWFISVPLCPDCPRGAHNGIHGRRSIWNVLKLTELKALGLTVRKLMEAA